VKDEATSKVSFVFDVETIEIEYVEKDIVVEGRDPSK
jgi:hypothetical protein